MLGLPEYYENHMRTWTYTLRLEKELRPDIRFFYHHLREGLKLRPFLDEKHLELWAKGFLVCRLPLKRLSILGDELRLAEFVISKIEKKKYLPCKSLDINVLIDKNLHRK